MAEMTVIAGAPAMDLAEAGQRPGADSGDPQLRTWAMVDPAVGNVGVWECRPGGWPVEDRRDTEVAYILSGRADITDAASGDVRTVQAGDLVVLPVGWSGRWDVTETVRKVYAIYATGDAAS